MARFDGKKRQRRFGKGKYKDVTGKRKQLTYSELSNKLLKTTDLNIMRALIHSYVRTGGMIPSINGRFDGDREMVGDCNGDGVINVLDIVEMINYILGTPSPNFIFENCDINGDGVINVQDVVSLINEILNPTNDDYGLPSEPSILDLGNRAYHLQYESSLPLSFSATADEPLTGDHPGHVLEHSTNPNNKVLITAPHGQNHYRPTRWKSSQDPSSGMKYCDYDCDDNTEDTDCNKSSDWCTGAMAKTLAEYTGAAVLYTRYKQMDPNYYDSLGIDYWERVASENIGSGNETDVYFPYGGIQTPAYYEEWVTQGTQGLHPFKQAIGEYLNEHPEVKLVIDLHGAGTTSHHWDVDIGLVGDNGSDGIITDNLTEVDNNGLTIQLLSQLGNTLQDNYIGLCDHDCPDGINANDIECAGEAGCLVEGICPDDTPFGGHGPISYNDFSADNQHTVTKFVREQFPASVFAVQIEMAGYYRCLSDSTPQNVGRMLNALGQYVSYANDNL